MLKRFAPSQRQVQTIFLVTNEIRSDKRPTTKSHIDIYRESSVRQMLE